MSSVENVMKSLHELIKRVHASNRTPFPKGRPRDQFNLYKLKSCTMFRLETALPNSEPLYAILGITFGFNFFN